VFLLALLRCYTTYDGLCHPVAPTLETIGNFAGDNGEYYEKVLHTQVQRTNLESTEVPPTRIQHGWYYSTGTPGLASSALPQLDASHTHTANRVVAGTTNLFMISAPACSAACPAQWCMPAVALTELHLLEYSIAQERVLAAAIEVTPATRVTATKGATPIIGRQHAAVVEEAAVKSRQRAAVVAQAPVKSRPHAAVVGECDSGDGEDRLEMSAVEMAEQYLLECDSGDDEGQPEMPAMEMEMPAMEMEGQYLLECDSGDDEGQPEMSSMEMAEQ
jgi:hypothetical protein